MLLSDCFLMLRENSSDVGINNQLTTLSSAELDTLLPRAGSPLDTARLSLVLSCGICCFWQVDPSFLWKSIGAASALPLQWLIPQLPKCWNHQPLAAEECACERSAPTRALQLSVRGGATQCCVVGRGQRSALHRLFCPCSLPSCLSISFIAAGGEEANLQVLLPKSV